MQKKLIENSQPFKIYSHHSSHTKRILYIWFMHAYVKGPNAVPLEIMGAVLSNI